MDKSFMRINVVSIRRSGHHAIINWAIPVLGGKVTHYDNVQIRGQSERPVWKHGEDHEIEIFSYEDLILSEIQHITSHNPCWIILRDPYNTFSSRYQINGKHEWWPKWKHDDTELWKSYAELFLDPPPNVVTINYNKWMTKKQYRNNLAKRIGGKFTDRNLQAVPKNGLGSSFSAMKFDGLAQEMDVMKRWTKLADDEDYHSKILRDQELSVLSYKIFNITCDKLLL